MRQAAVAVVRKLHKAGFDALFAGGCVRDMLMGKRPHDYDLATSAKPKDVCGLFRRTQKVGAKFGVVLVRVGGFSIEVATFRTDLDYEDGRHPSKVHFTDAREDALRRDFTINGMFYDPLKKEIVDHVDGQADLKAGVIRAIGDPQRRFTEDHLRILRAIRFAARLGFRIEPATFAAMREQAPLIARISPERIRLELEQMLSHPSRAGAFGDLVRSGVLRHLWPGADRLLPAADRTALLLEALPAESAFELALAALMSGLSDREVESACNALRCSNHTKRVTGWLIAQRDSLSEPSSLTLADLKLLMAHPAFAQLLDLDVASLHAAGRPLTAHRQILVRVRAIPRAEISPEPLLDGGMLVRLGLPAGPAYKAILDKVYYAQLNGDVIDRHAALDMARRLVMEVPHRRRDA
jgi:poly(A) polymerase